MNNPALGFDPQKLISGLVRSGQIWFDRRTQPPKPDSKRDYMRLYKRAWRARRRELSARTGVVLPV